MSTAFSIKESLAFGWRTFKAHPWVFVKVSLVYLALQFVLGMVQGILPEPLAPLVGIIVGTFIGIGILTFYLKAHDAPTEAKLNLLWAPAPFWRYIVTSIIMGILIMIGFVFLIVPGVILALAWSFALYLVVERNLWTKSALMESARLTRGSRVKLFLMNLALVGINLLGMLALFVGLFVTVPITFLASIHAYRVLSGKAGETVAETPAASEALPTPEPAPVA